MIARFGSEDSRKQTLESHLLETAELARIFGKEFDFDALVGMAGLLHDAGKATSSWQKYLMDSISGKAKRKVDHATAGAVYLEEIYEKKISLAKIAIQAAVMYHHGSGLPDMIGLDGKSEFLERLGKKEIKKDMEEIKVNLSSSIKQKIDECLQSEIMKNDARDVLFNNCKKGCSSKQIQFNMGLHLRNLSSCLIDADRSDSAAFETNDNPFPSSGIPDWNNLLVRLENHLAKVKSKDALGKIRSYVSDRCASFGRSEKGIYTCSAFTGAGKTLASLRFALEQAKKHGMKRIFIIAPYTSIIDQNADVIRGILEDENTKGQIVLECHSNLSAEKKENLKESEENYSRFEETWNSPVIITTMVQFLETMFGSGTKKIRRMHQLANSVLVFDEVQTLPVKTTYLFNWGLEYLVNVCGCSALLCTATQPCLDKIGKEGGYHLKMNGEVIEKLAEHFDSLKRVCFIDMTDGGKKSHNASEICNYIQKQMSDVKSFLAVVNTKPQAKELFDLVKESGCADYVYHLSTSMCPAHRKKVIAEIREKLSIGERIVCISTRLIEAGVDVSFEGALRYIAGLDSIIQTAGRCNRNNELYDSDGNKRHGKVAIFSYADEKLGSLEELKIGQDCMERILREFKPEWKNGYCDLIQPRVINCFFKYYYGRFTKSMLEYSVRGKDSSILDLLSDNMESKREYERINQNQNWRQLLYTQAFRTAWENFEVIADATTGVIVPYENDVHGRLCALERGENEYGDKLRHLLKEAQQYSVNVYSNQLERMLKEKMVCELIPESDIYALSEEFYDAELGLVYESSSENISVLNF